MMDVTGDEVIELNVPCYSYAFHLIKKEKKRLKIVNIRNGGLTCA